MVKSRGQDQIFGVEDPGNYIQGFNWVSNWIDKYFFNKVSDFISGIIFLIAIYFFNFLLCSHQERCKLNQG